MILIWLYTHELWYKFIIWCVFKWGVLSWNYGQSIVLIVFFVLTLEATATRQVPRKHWGVTNLLLGNQRCLATKLGLILLLFNFRRPARLGYMLHVLNNSRYWRFGRSFSFLNGWFVGSMLIFQGVFILASFHFFPRVLSNACRDFIISYHFHPATPATRLGPKASQLEKSLTLTAQSEGCPVFKNCFDMLSQETCKQY